MIIPMFIRVKLPETKLKILKTIPGEKKFITYRGIKKKKMKQLYIRNNEGLKLIK